MIIDVLECYPNGTQKIFQKEVSDDYFDIAEQVPPMHVPTETEQRIDMLEKVVLAILGIDESEPEELIAKELPVKEDVRSAN